jgi:hypothetical protein
LLPLLETDKRFAVITLRGNSVSSRSARIRATIVRLRPAAADWARTHMSPSPLLSYPGRVRTVASS